MKKSLFTLFFVLLTIASWAYDAKVDGIYYNLNKEDKTAEVTNETGSFDAQSYSEDVVIPEEITVDGTTYSVTSIGYGAFMFCALTSVFIPNSVTSIGDDAFSHSSLSSVNIPSSVTSICNNSFSYCYGLTSFVVDSDNKYYSSEDNVLFNKDKTELLFCIIAKTENYDIPNSVTSIGDYAFQGCDGLTSVTIPNSVTSIGEWAFQGCSGLTSIEIPNSVTNIGDNAFDMCSGLTSVEIPNSVSSIGWYAFCFCSRLTSVTIPNSVTSIGGGVFGYCFGLTSVTIPNSVTSIGGYAFQGCTGLLDVYCYADNVPETSSNSFQSVKVDKVTLHVPAVALEDYKATKPWSYFGSIVPLTDEETSVKTPFADSSAPVVVFDLQGHRLAQPQRGVNIINGKKVVIK